MQCGEQGCMTTSFAKSFTLYVILMYSACTSRCGMCMIKELLHVPLHLSQIWPISQPMKPEVYGYPLVAYEFRSIANHVISVKVSHLSNECIVSVVSY